jgi:carbamoyl-phosphate synthase large subunit
MPVARGDRTVLITGAGAPGTRGTVYALKNNPDGVKVRIVGTDIQSDVVGRFFVDQFHSVPIPEDPDYVDALLSICRTEKVELLIPQTTREIVVLSHLKAEFHREGTRVMVSGPDAIEIANNKWRLLQAFERLGLPYPAYHLVRSESELIEGAKRMGYPGQPVVVKPPVSNGMRGLRVLKENAWDVERFLADKPSGVEISLDELVNILRRGGQWPELLLTEYLPGPEYSVDAFLGDDVCFAIPRLRRAIRSGISFDNALEYRDDLMSYTLQAARYVGLQYAVGFQFKLDAQGVAKVLESNPRIQGTMVASLVSGVNIIWLAVKYLAGEPLPAMPVLQPARFYRYWGGLGVSGDATFEI